MAPRPSCPRREHGSRRRGTLTPATQRMTFRRFACIQHLASTRGPDHASSHEETDPSGGVVPEALSHANGKVGSVARSVANGRANSNLISTSYALWCNHRKLCDDTLSSP